MSPAFNRVRFFFTISVSRNAVSYEKWGTKRQPVISGWDDPRVTMPTGACVAYVRKLVTVMLWKTTC